MQGSISPALQKAKAITKQEPQVDSLYLYGSHILILAGTLFSDRELLSELKDECDQ